MNHPEIPQETNPVTPADTPPSAPTNPTLEESAATPPNAPPTPPAEGGEDAPKKPDSKKRAKTILISLVVALGVLLLLNLIPFEQLAKLAVEDLPEETEPVITYPAENFYTPDYDEDVSQDEIYQKYNRLLTFSRDGESFSVTPETAEGQGPVCMLFQAYMESLMAGDTDACNALFTKEYLEKLI